MPWVCRRLKWSFVRQELTKYGSKLVDDFYAKNSERYRLNRNRSPMAKASLEPPGKALRPGRWFGR